MGVFGRDVDFFAVLNIDDRALINGVGNGLFDLSSKSTQEPPSVDSAFVFSVDSSIDYLGHKFR